MHFQPRSVRICGLISMYMLAQMDFCREMMGVFRQLSSRLFSSEEDRARLVDATQEHLDGLVSLEDEAGQEEGGAS